MNFSILNILLPCSLMLYVINLISENHFLAIVTGLSSVFMALSGFNYINGQPFKHTVKSIPLLNFLAQRVSNSEMCSKQNDKSLFVLLFSLTFFLSGQVSLFVFSHHVNMGVLCLSSALFSSIFAMFLVVKEKRLDL